MQILRKSASQISLLGHAGNTFLPLLPAQGRPQQAVIPQHERRWHSGAARCVGWAVLRKGRLGTLVFSTNIVSSARHSTSFLHK